MSMHSDVKYVMITAEQIAQKVKELGAELDRIYEGKKPIMVCILKGSTLFLADLIRAMETSMELDFMRVSSYGSGTV